VRWIIERAGTSPEHDVLEALGKLRVPLDAETTLDGLRPIDFDRFEVRSICTVVEPDG
jgi:hypothetical protein